MRRRAFLGTSAAAAGLAGGITVNTEADASVSDKTRSFTRIPDRIAGMTLRELRDDYRHRLFDLYLPFWEKGGVDFELGGFVTELNDNGGVVTPEKFIWYQGRGLWVYAFLYNNFGKDQKWLDIATQARNFMVKYMYRGDGMWHQMVHSDGRIKDRSDQGSERDIYGPMFAAAGLQEYYKATRRQEDLDIAVRSIYKSVERYDNPNYEGVLIRTEEGTRPGRSQGHSFMLIWTLAQLLTYHRDSGLERIASEQVHHVMNSFWNPDYGINNETLYHDYSRIPERAAQFAPGHSIETLWMVMEEAIRTGDSRTFIECKNRIRRFIEMSWDYIYDGMGCSNYNVFRSERADAGPSFETKTMWAHVEVLVATVMALEYTGDVWALEHYERARNFTINAMNTPSGVWRQATDRYGVDKQRSGISIYRRDNFHQPRYQLYNLLSVERMIKNRGRLTRFPKA